MIYTNVAWRRIAFAKRVQTIYWNAMKDNLDFQYVSNDEGKVFSQWWKKKNSFLFTILMSATMKKKKDIIFSDKKRKKIFLSFVLILIFLYGGGKIHSNSWFFFHSWYSVFVQPICYNSNIFFNEKNKRYYLYYGEGKIFLILLLSSILISFTLSIIVKKEWYSWLCRFFHSSILRL